MPENLNIEQQHINTEEASREIVLGTNDIPSDFSIEEAVITILDKGATEPILNEYTLELTESIASYLTKHIEKCFNSDRIKFGVFNAEVNRIKDTSCKLLRNEIEIIEASKQFSTILFEIMHNDDGIESCDLVTIKLATNRGPVVAILKLDYAKNFIHQVDFLEEKINIGIAAIKTGLPNTGIQKAAFIKPSMSDGFELYYLDLYKKKDGVSNNIQYWAKNFLNCSEIDNSKATTLDFVKCAEDWIRVTKLDNARQSEEIRSAIREKLLDEDISSISISDLAIDVFGSDDEKREGFTEYMSSLNFDDEVIIDKPTAIKKLSKIKIKIDKDTTLNIDRDVYNDNSRFEITENSDGSINMTIKNITSYIEK